MPKTLSEGIEETVEKLLEELSYGGRKNLLDDTMGMDTAREIIRITLHQELQKAYEQGVQDELCRESKNMDVVIAGMIQKDRQDTITAVIEMVKGVKIPITLEDRIESAFGCLEHDKYNQALTDIITKLQALTPSTKTSSLELLDRAWEYTVKAMIEESGSKEEMKKFLLTPPTKTSSPELLD